MADSTIYDYDSALSIDGATHWLLIQPGDNSVDYKKINRETFLGVTGQPADISTTQNITNKTLDNTNIITSRDDRFTLQDSGDVTRQATFQLSGITAGQTRVMTLPDASTTLVGTGTTQTLTNKTLTSPVVTGGSITNSTISVDAISEYTSANGVTVDGLSIKDGKLNTNNSVVTANVTDSAITPAKLLAGTGSSWVWQSYVPTTTNLTNATVTATWCQIGKTVFYQIRAIATGATPIGGAVTFTLPTASTSFRSTANTGIIGWADFLDSGTANYAGIVRQNSTTVIGVFAYGANGVHTTLSSSVPFTWAVNDQINVVGMYEAA